MVAVRWPNTSGICGPFPEAHGKVRFLIVAIDYFTKWIEAKLVSMITGNQVKRFKRDNIVCKFGLPGEIISDNEKQLRDNPLKDWCEKINIKQRKEERKRQSAKLKAKSRWKSIIMPESAAQPFAQETSSTATMKQATPKTAESWVQNGKDHTKWWKHLDEEHTSLEMEVETYSRAHGMSKI
ncbi:reverse transcriptase domain-containing protein [Tanacetum coccineum]